MIPLTLLPIGEERIIRRIGGTQGVRAHLQDLGFVVGGFVTVVAEMGGSLIVRVKDARIALNKDMASKIMV